MTWQRFNSFIISCVLLSLMLSSSGQAQSNFNLRRPGGLPTQQAAAKQNARLTQPETSYTYTLFDFPGTLSTFSAGTEVSGKVSKLAVVGCYEGTAGEQPASNFLMRYTVGKTKTTESYESIAVPGAEQGAFQCATSVNKSGTIVGLYTDASGNYEGWELIGTTFSSINVPFQGAVSTWPSNINDSGEIAGDWFNGDSYAQGFTLVNGTYTSINYPGAVYTDVWAVNNKGDLAGDYFDSPSGVNHGMTDIGGVFTTLDPPGSIYTFIQGLDDHDNAVGWFCTTTECEHAGGGGEQGFLYSGGNFTIFNFPGAVSTYLLGISNAGVLVGYYQDVAGNFHGFLATP
jgi:hypothetical protein